MKTKRTTTLALVAALLGGCVGRTDPDAWKDRGADAGLDAQQAFARLQTLAGHWEATSPDAPAAVEGSKPGAPATIPIEYQVTAGGHAVQERLFAGTEHEMTTLYYLEGRDLAAVHYCAIGNRPHLRLDRAHSTRDDLHLEWDGSATDIDPKKDAHIHGGRIRFLDADTVETEWTFWSDGKVQEAHRFHLDRKAGFKPLGPASGS